MSDSGIEEITLQWVEWTAPWELVLAAAGMRQIDYTRWLSRDGIEHEVEGAGGELSWLMRPGVQPFDLTCRAFLVDELHQGKEDAAAQWLVEGVLRPDAVPAMTPRMRADLIKHWEAHGIGFTDLRAWLEARAPTSNPAPGPDVRPQLAHEPTPAERAARAATPAVGGADATLHQAYAWPEDSPLAAVLAFLRQFLVLQSEHHFIALTLWIAHTYCIKDLEVTPRLAITSPQPACGKTLVLDLVGLLAQNSLAVVTPSLASIFRSISTAEDGVTLLLDEADALFGSRGASDSEQIRGVLNSGYKRGYRVSRAGHKNKNYTPETFEVFAPVAIAALRDLPETLLSRSIHLPMRRRRPTDRVAPYRPRQAKEQAASVVQGLKHWARQLPRPLPEPQLPDELVGRDAEIWEPLLALAECAGPDWASAARAAAVAGVAGSAEVEGTDVQLLRLIKDCFTDVEWLWTEDLIEYINEEDVLNDENLSARRLASLLRPFGVRPQQRRHGNKVRRGYAATDFEDAWSRYL